MNKLNYLALALVSLALAACNSHEETPGADPDGKAWIGLNLSFPKSPTKAADASDTNAESMETAVKKISLYMQAPGLISGIVKVKELTPADFTATTGSGGANLLTSKAAILVPSGNEQSRKLYVVINEPATPPFTANLFDESGARGIYEATIAQLADATNGFAMFSTAGVAATLHTDPADALASPTAIAVSRAAAKVLVTASNGAINPGAEFDDSGNTGKFAANTLKWLVGNNNKKIYPLPHTGNEDPNYPEITTGTTLASLAAEYEQLTGTPAYAMQVPAYDATIVTGYENGGTYVQYCNENTNAIYQVGNTTYLSFQAVFTPDAIVEASEVTAIEASSYTANGTFSTPTTFYYHIGSKSYFNQAAYDKYTDAGGLAGNPADFYGPYTDGECYYFVPLRNGDLANSPMGVFRNTYYTVRVKSLLAPGNPNPLNPHPTTPDAPGPTPEEPIDQLANIAVEITIQPWNPVSMGDLDLK